jgi:hypothetical protein
MLALALTLVAFPIGTLASHDFTDVPDSNIYHADISALADSGVTTGCGGGNFCPGAFVTREQMAAFMNRLGALSVGKVPVVNATSVDGLDGLGLLGGTEFIPSGMTVTGAGMWDHASIVDNDVNTILVELPGRASTELDETTVNFAPSAEAFDDDATCTGNPGAPTAPAGKVCIYGAESAALDTAQGRHCLAGFFDRCFRITFFTNAVSSGTDMYLAYTWAYTAP